MRQYYLLGPMSVLPSHNFPAFEAACKDLRARGFTILSPHEWDDDGDSPEERKYPWEYYMERDVRNLLPCTGAIALPGWEKSDGAKSEVFIFAFLFGRPVYSYQPRAPMPAINQSLLRAVLANFVLEREMPRWGGPLIHDVPETGSSISVDKIAAGTIAAVIEETPKTTLHEAYDLVYGARQGDYGHPLDNWQLTADLMTPIAKKAIREKGRLDAEEAVLLMQPVKIARELNVGKRDNRVDGPGYWEVLDMIITERLRRRTDGTVVGRHYVKPEEA